MIDLRLGDCLDVLPTIPSESVDAVITDPPYPCIKRDYGMLTEAQWWDMMMVVCAETQRILKPTGSAVFILQPNSRKVGSMRGWLWEFMAWVCREWNMVQDAWWWNICALPNIHSSIHNLMRPSVKGCIWCGPPHCYRNQGEALWQESASNAGRRYADRINGANNNKERRPSGQAQYRVSMRAAAELRGGVTPFNLLPIESTDAGRKGSNGNGHGASTPLKLADWWTRYICPPGGTVCDPFMGSGTMGIAAVQRGCSFIGIEKEDRPGYFPTAQERIGKAEGQQVMAL